MQEENFMMERITYALANARFPGRLRVAPMAVIKEGDSHRIMHDGSNFVHVNHGIRVPDLELYPTAADVAGALTSDWLGPAQYLAMKLTCRRRIVEYL